MEEKATVTQREEQLERELESLRAELKEADRRAGEAERRLEQASKSEQARSEWLDRAKARWFLTEDCGQHRNVSFDIIWEECLRLKRQEERRKQGGTDSSEKQDEKLAAELEEMSLELRTAESKIHELELRSARNALDGQACLDQLNQRVESLGNQLNRSREVVDKLTAENSELHKKLLSITEDAKRQGEYACEMLTECKRAQISEQNAIKECRLLLEEHVASQEKWTAQTWDVIAYITKADRKTLNQAPREEERRSFEKPEIHQEH